MEEIKEISNPKVKETSDSNKISDSDIIDDIEDKIKNIKQDKTIPI